ncbi:MAG: ADP-ribosylation factor-like protein [Candidatus Helarchaeales archaeon]
MPKVIKASIMGHPGVGKSTLMKLLKGASEQELKQPHSPTVGIDFATVEVQNDLKLSMHDLGGQEQFRFLWDSFIPGTKVLCFITDSTPSNVAQTKKLVEKYKSYNGAKVIAVANKQDLPEALSPEEIQARLGIKTVGMVAIDPSNRRVLFEELQKLACSV